MIKVQPRIHGKFISPNPEPLAKQVIGVRLPESIHEAVYLMPNRAEWLRRVITEAAHRELLGAEQE